MCMYMNYAFFLIEPSSIPSPLLSTPKSSHESVTQSLVSGKSSRYVFQHVMCIRVCMCLYYNLVFVLKGTCMCNQCFTMWYVPV